MRELISLLGLFCLAACGPGLLPEQQRIIEACGSLKPNSTRARNVAYSGDLEAIDCQIARADLSLIHTDLTPPFVLLSLRWRYIRWIVTGDKPEDIDALARQTDQLNMEAFLVGALDRHLTLTGQSYSGLFDENGCFIRPPKMDQLYELAQPHPDMGACENSKRDHPFA